MSDPSRLCRLSLLLAVLLLGAACSGTNNAKEAPTGTVAARASSTVSTGKVQPTQSATSAKVQPIQTSTGAAASGRLGGQTSPSPAAQQTRSAAQPGQAQWTVLVYMAANNNLEGSTLLNLLQMADAASSPQVYVVAQITRDPASDITDDIGNLGSFTTTKRVLVQHGRFVERDDLGKVNSGDPATLADFISWGERTYPAQHYMLDLSDHGGAWQGCCEDDTFKNFMGLGSLQRAFKQGGGAPLDIIGFDACLMSSVEVGLALQPYGSLLIGSEESEPGLGWDYTAFLSALAGNPSMSPKALAQTVADTYLAGLTDKAPDEALYSTFSVTDLQQLTPVGTTTAAFMSALNRYVNNGTQSNLPERLTRFSQVFLQAEFETPAFGSTGPGDLGISLDLGILAQNAAVESGSPEVQKASADLKQALSRAVVYNITGKGYAGMPPSGISIATLATGDTHKKDVKAYSNLTFAAPTGWLALVQEFDTAVAAASDLGAQPTVASLQTSARSISRGATATISGQVRDDLVVTDVKLSVTTALNGQDVQISQDNRVKHLGKRIDFTYDFDGRGWYMTDGKVNELAYSEDWRPGQRIVFGTYRQVPQDDGDEAYLLIDEASGRILQAFDIEGDLGLLGALLPGPRSTFSPYVFDASDEVTEIPLDPVNLKTAKFTRSPLPAGKYSIVVDADNISGNSVSDSVSVTVTGP